MATGTVQTTREFSDLDLNFNIHPVKKDINRSVGDIAVVNSLKNLILTNFYEKPFQPDFGSNIKNLLFENVDIVTATAIEREIMDMIKNYEPRVAVDFISVNPLYDQNLFRITMRFFIQNQTTPTSITFQLERIR